MLALSHILGTRPYRGTHNSTASVYMLLLTVQLRGRGMLAAWAAIHDKALRAELKVP